MRFDSISQIVLPGKTRGRENIERTAEATRRIVASKYVNEQRPK